MTTRIGALITGGDFQGLGVLRTLAKKSIPTVLVDNDYCIGKFSKFCKTFYKSPPPSEKEAYTDQKSGSAVQQGLQKGSGRW